MTRLMSKKEVAERLGLSIYTIDKWVSTNQNIPYTKLGSRVLFSENDVEAFILSRRIVPVSTERVAE